MMGRLQLLTLIAVLFGCNRKEPELQSMAFLTGEGSDEADTRTVSKLSGRGEWVVAALDANAAPIEFQSVVLGQGRTILTRPGVESRYCRKLNEAQGKGLNVLGIGAAGLRNRPTSKPKPETIGTPGDLGKAKVKFAPKVLFAWEKAGNSSRMVKVRRTSEFLAFQASRSLPGSSGQSVIHVVSAYRTDSEAHARGSIDIEAPTDAKERLK